ncbi:MAG TPA: ribonuclease E inhibitor RraB, partial [Candidatus Angelobacter sp.]
MFLALLAGVPALWPIAGAGSDQAALLKARKAGVDLSQPHKILFTLKLPEHATQEAISRLQQAGFNAQAWITQGSDRILFATKTMVPEPAALQAIRRDFNSLLSSLLAEFERGWGSYERWEILDI